MISPKCKYGTSLKAADAVGSTDIFLDAYGRTRSVEVNDAMP